MWYFILTVIIVLLASALIGLYFEYKNLKQRHEEQNILLNQCDKTITESDALIQTYKNYISLLEEKQ